MSFEESAWSIPLLAGLIDVGLFDTMFASALVLLNLLMQSAFSIILLTPAFMGDEFESKIQSAQSWRTSVAHDERWVDAKCPSEVCNMLRFHQALHRSALVLSVSSCSLVPPGTWIWLALAW